MYMVIFKNDYHGTFVVIADNLSTLEAAGKARQVSGDLVVDKTTNEVPKDSIWLWDWERQDGMTYAHRQFGVRVEPGKRVR